MATGKTHEFKDTVYTEIPDEIAEKLDVEPGQHLEFKNPYKDLVIIVPRKKKETGKEKTKGLESEELRVLKEIGDIWHEERTLENVKKQLDKEDHSIFNRLIKKGVLFKYQKEGEKRVGIDKEYFPLVTGKKDQDLLQKLEEQGYLVIEDEDKVKDLQDELKDSGKDDEVKGVRGFDKKYYIIKQEKLEDIEEELEDLLSEEKIIHEISEDLGEEKNLCKAALVVMREDGKVVEKGKNIYKLS